MAARIWHDIHSRSFIHLLQSITGWQEIAYRHIITMAVYVKFPHSFQRNSHRNRWKLTLSTTLIRSKHPRPRIYLIFPETWFIGRHFCRRQYLPISIQNFWWGPRNHPFCIRLHISHSLSFKIDDFGSNQKKLLMKLHLSATGCHLPYGITHFSCHPTY